MNASDPTDAARLNRSPAFACLPSCNSGPPSPNGLTRRAGPLTLPAAHTEHDVAGRGQRRIERHFAEARLPPGKTLSSFDFDAVPAVSRAQVMAPAEGDSWLETGANLIQFCPPGEGKTHLAATIGPGLIGNGGRVLHPNHRPRPEAAGRPP